MIKKLIAGGLMAAVAAVAVLLVTAGGSTASAVVNGVSVAPATVNAGAAAVVTVDADNAGGDVRVLVTVGDFTACTDAPADAVAGTPDACALDVTSAIANFAGAADRDFTANDDAADAAGGNVDNLIVNWTAPATGPATAAFTVIQGASTKSASITVRGSADKVVVTAHTAVPTNLAACTGAAIANVIRSTTATVGQAAANLCTIVTDSAGTRLPNQAVVYSTTAGTFAGAGLADVTAANGNAAAASTLGSGTTGASGTTATVTANSGGKSATTTVKFGGDPAKCAITPEPATLQPGASSVLKIAVMDSTDGPVADGIAVGVAQANASVGGAGAAVVGAASATTNGESQATVIAATAGPVAVGANIAVGANAPVSCTGTLIVAGAVVPPGGGGEGSGLIDGEIAADGTSLVGWGGGSTEDLVAAVGEQVDADACSIHATVDGEFVTYVPGAAIAAVNANWMAAFADGVSVPAVIVTC